VVNEREREEIGFEFGLVWVGLKKWLEMREELAYENSRMIK
jgi:hypothetical protein